VADDGKANTNVSNEEKRKKGIAFYKKLVEGQPRNPSSSKASIPADFSRYTMEHLFGDVWQGDDLPLELRSLLTCTILVALNREAEQRIHFPGAKNLGVEREQLEAMITHAAHYAGWPVAASAFRVLGEVWPVEEED
jgi:4-carboxymuconolactone decarboxylase